MPDDRFLHKRAGLSEKLSQLTDLEYRVWTQYLLSADDFGVMRMSALTIRQENDALAQRPEKLVHAALESIVSVGLLSTFKSNGRRYLYQADWQDFQKVRFPARTSHPKPPITAPCTMHTAWLITAHPGGDKQLASWRHPDTFTRKNGRDVPHSTTEPTTVATSVVTTEPTTVVDTVVAARPQRGPNAATAPSRADGRAQPFAFSLLPLAFSHRTSESGSEEKSAEGGIPGDQAWGEFKAAYPSARRNAGFMAEQRFIAACHAVGFTALIVALERHKQTEQWKKGMVPSLDKWLEKELWIQEPDTPDNGAGGNDAAREHLRKIQQQREVMR